MYTLRRTKQQVNSNCSLSVLFISIVLFKPDIKKVQANSSVSVFHTSVAHSLVESANNIVILVFTSAIHYLPVYKEVTP